DHLHFGAAFSAQDADTGGFENRAVGVDVARHAIRFATPHLLRTGDAVYYDPRGNSSVAGLDAATVYYVRALDPFTIQLFTVRNEAMAGSVDIPVSGDGSAIEADNVTIDTTKATAAGETFQTGDLVTYQAQEPVAFNTGVVNVRYSTDIAGNIIKTF